MEVMDVGMRVTTIFADHFEDSVAKQIMRDDNGLAIYAKRIVDDLLTDYTVLIIDVDHGLKDKSEIVAKITELANKESLAVTQRDELIREVLNELFLYGRLQELIEDGSISDIDFSSYKHGVIKRHGKKEVLPAKYLFSSEEEFRHFAVTRIRRNDGIINENNSHERISDDRFKLRINVSIPPRNRMYTSMQIRKHPMVPYTMVDLLKLKMFTEQQMDILIDLVRQKKRFIICGKGAAGKTTLLRAMMMETSELNTYLVAEKDVELYLEKQNFIQQKIKKAAHGGLEVTLGDLVKDGLTMSLDGYVIGEITGDEAWYFINAGNTDHVIAGTIHAESIQDVPHRLLSLVETYHPGPKSETILALIARGLDAAIYMKEFKVVSIGEVGDFDHKQMHVTVTDTQVS